MGNRLKSPSSSIPVISLSPPLSLSSPVLVVPITSPAKYHPYVRYSEEEASNPVVCNRSPGSPRVTSQVMQVKKLFRKSVLVLNLQIVIKSHSAWLGTAVSHFLRLPGRGRGRTSLRTKDAINLYYQKGLCDSQEPRKLRHLSDLDTSDCISGFQFVHQ